MKEFRADREAPLNAWTNDDKLVFGYLTAVFSAESGGPRAFWVDEIALHVGIDTQRVRTALDRLECELGAIEPANEIAWATVEQFSVTALRLEVEGDCEIRPEVID